MKFVPLTQGYSAIVDDEDYTRLSNYNWCVTKSHGNVYAVRNAKRGESKRGLILMHRELCCELDSKPTVDHVNGNTLDNRRSNLRPATYGENNANRPLAKKSRSSSFRGVHWFKPTNRWRCSVSKIHVGYFKDEKEAALEYNKAAILKFGDFSVLNVV